MTTFVYDTVSVSENVPNTDLFNRMGKDGWEIIGFLQKSVPGCALVYLKLTIDKP